MREGVFKTKLLFDVNELNEKEIKCIYIGSSNSLRETNTISHQQQIYIQLSFENIIVVDKGLEIIYKLNNNEPLLNALIENLYSKKLSEIIFKIIKIANSMNKIIQQDLNNQIINDKIKEAYNEYYNRTINTFDNQIYVDIQMFSIDAKLYSLDCIN
jgi:hypothetical protein